jgi:hypothetical protein
MKTTIIEHDSNDNWAQVELYRWQHGNLPGEPGTKLLALDVPTALMKMAEALSQPDQSKWPAPFNVASVLSYAAKQLKAKSPNVQSSGTATGGPRQQWNDDDQMSWPGQN